MDDRAGVNAKVGIATSTGCERSKRSVTSSLSMRTRVALRSLSEDKRNQSPVSTSVRRGRQALVSPNRQPSSDGTTSALQNFLLGNGCVSRAPWLLAFTNRCECMMNGLGTGRQVSRSIQSSRQRSPYLTPVALTGTCADSNPTAPRVAISSRLRPKESLVYPSPHQITPLLSQSSASPNKSVSSMKRRRS